MIDPNKKRRDSIIGNGQLPTIGRQNQTKKLR